MTYDSDDNIKSKQNSMNVTLNFRTANFALSVCEIKVHFIEIIKSNECIQHRKYLYVGRELIFALKH